MKLLGTDTSPYVRKAVSCLLEKNIPTLIWVDAARAQPGSQVARQSAGAHPALILDDETCVFDSTVIAEYADTLNDTPILIPRSNALERMRVNEGSAGGMASWTSAWWCAPKRYRPADSRMPISSHGTMIAITRHSPMRPSSWAGVSGAR